MRLATWNVEYLVEPATFTALAPECVAEGGKVPGALRRIPCSIVPRLARDEADFATLRRYASQLGADVVALQEVDGPASAARVFPGYEFRLTFQSGKRAIGPNYQDATKHTVAKHGDTLKLGDLKLEPMKGE